MSKSTGETSLHIAVLKKDLKTMNYILRNSSRMNKCVNLLKLADNSGNTAIHLCTTSKLIHCISSHIGNERFTQLLSIRNDKMQTPFHIAVESHNMDLLQKLLNVTSTNDVVRILEQRDISNKTALDLAASAKSRMSSEIIKIIVTTLGHKKALNLLKSKDQHGDTFIHHLLMWECDLNSLENALLRLKIDQQLEFFNQTNKQGVSSLDNAQTIIRDRECNTAKWLLMRNSRLHTELILQKDDIKGRPNNKNHIKKQA